MMCADGLAKLIEECGELMQIAGKKLAYFTADEHPDGGPPLDVRLEDELADVIAACRFVSMTMGLDGKRVFERAQRKEAAFRQWHEQGDNNEHGVQIPTVRP